MISTAGILGIFFQIFTAGISIAACYSFFLRYKASKNKEDYYLSLLFGVLAVYSSLTVISQILYSTDHNMNTRLIVYRIMAVALVAGALLISYFLKEKFTFKENFFLNSFVLLCVGEIYLLFRSPINQIMNIKDVSIVPGIKFLGAIPPEVFWVVLWLFMGYKFIVAAKASKVTGEKNVWTLAGVSSLLVVLSSLLSVAYSMTSEPYWYVVMWGVNLFFAIGFFWGNIISPKEEVSKYPLSFFRTRILYKLIIMFVFLIVLLLEVTTVLTINLNQISLEKAIRVNYQNIARSLAERIDYSSVGGQANKEEIRRLIEREASGKRLVYIVDDSGKLFVYADPNEEGKDISLVGSVKDVLSGLYGTDEYDSDFFAKPADKRVIGAYAPVSRLRLGVIIEEPVWDLYSDIRLVSTNSLMIVIIGIILTVSVGIFFAKSIESSIKEVINGTDAVRKGDLTHKIKINSIDEIGQLADAFNQMTKELKQTQENLISSEKFASLGTMAAGMAHEIKNPLVSLRTFTQLMPQRFQDEEFRNKFSAIVPVEIEKINKIAESLLRFGRPHKPEVTKVNVNEVLEEILALFDNEARKNNVKVATKLSEIPFINADQGQISQALVNIILNSIQAMPNSGELTVKTEVGEIIKVSANANEEGVQEEPKHIPVVFIEISDTGIGIPEENLKNNKIFEPFFTTKEVGGTGMGLPITLRIIESHGGSIRVKSQVGKGTTFLITLPQNENEKV
jgi:signal transduction histidine kinase